MDLRRMVASLLLAGTALVTTATPAMAHTQLVGSDPAEGAPLPTAPQQIQLTFGGPVQLPADAITVTGPDGARWTVGPPTVSGAAVTAPVQPTGPAGQYTIDYRILSSDGDPVSGAVRFTLTAPATPTTSAPAPPPADQPAANTPPVQPASDTSIPVWAWIIGAVVLVGVGLVLALRLGGPRRSSSKPD